MPTDCLADARRLELQRGRPRRRRAREVVQRSVGMSSSVSTTIAFRGPGGSGVEELIWDCSISSE
jgi:hypothetical protein